MARPRWADVMAVSFVVALSCGVGFMSTEVGRQALVDQLERSANAFGRRVDDRQYARFEELSRHGSLYGAAQAVAMGPLLAFGAAAIVYGFFTTLQGGAATYRQTLSIAAHAGVILAVRQVVTTPLNYTRETLSSPASLTMFAPMLDAASPVARFLGAIDLFVVWWIVVLALGVAVVYRRPARPIAAAFVAAYVGFAVLMAIAMFVSGGTV
jgi:hypothetical protein